jgi:tetratricopeptide (TPR) repeat protein
MKWRLAFAGLVVAYALLILPFTHYLKSRPVEVKLGYLPHPQMLKAASGEHRPTVAALVVVRVLFYFGTIIDKLQENVIIRPEFLNMFKTLQGAVHLDPYNMDAYYFAQAAFTWELGRVNDVNHLLEQGMSYRTWDPWLPFYLGFNYAYFLKDYSKAATYMQRAAEISGNPLYANLAARYFYESEQSSLGLAFLDTMIHSAKDKVVRQSYEMRRDALKAVLAITEAIEVYRTRFGQPLSDLSRLVHLGLLPELPVDPYGGTFYLDEQGKVRTTSKFATPSVER